MSRIDLNVVATGNFTQLQAQLAKIKAQVADINKTMSGASMVNPTALSNMQKYSSVMADQLRMTGMFETKLVSLTSETEKFGQSLVRGNLKLGDSFRTSMGYLKGQQTEIQKLARQQVRLQNSMTMAVGDGKAMVITPRGLDETIHKMQIANQEFRIFRQVLANGSTQLINWGKNTQWAGRQLTVGLTVPLTIFGATASKVFMDADRQLTRLVKVYGDASKGIVQPAELESIRKETLGLATDIAKNMGVAVEETLGIAADIAATGKEGNELLAATSEAMRLSVLGEVDRQEAMRATISIQNVFKKDTAGLAESINFLNAVENQTSTSLDDLTTGIVKAGPVVQGLGGDIEDLSLMMVAMREGGITAAEAANAIKSSLASLINPTKQTQDLMNGFGIDLIGIVDKNAGDVIGTLTDLQSALSGLDELSRQRAIEQIFGKFQFSRINALLNNLNQAGSQTQQVLALAGMSAQELAQSAERELQAYTESATGRFTRALEGIKASLIPIGETFTNIGTMVLELGTKIVEIFNSLPDPVKNFLKGLGAITAIAGPIIMIAGVFGNFIGYLLKGVSSLLALKSAGRGVFEYFTPESVAAKQSADLFTEAIYDEKAAVNALAVAIETLSNALEQLSASANMSNAALDRMGNSSMAAAEAAAVGFRPAYTYAGAASRGTVGGFERSHLSEGFKGTGLYPMQTTASLLPSTSAAAKFQQSGFNLEYFYGDPRYGGKTREEILKGQAAYKTTTGAAAYKSMMEAPDKLEQMTRLVPSQQDFAASAGKYIATLKSIEKLPADRIKTLTKDMQAALREGDHTRAKMLLDEALDTNGVAFQRLVQEETDVILSMTGSVNEITTTVATQEQQLLGRLRSMGATGFLTGKSGAGKGLDQFIYATAGGGISELEIALEQAVQQLVNPIKTSARQFLNMGRKAGMKIVQYTNSKGQKFIADVTMGAEKAVVYAVNSKTGLIERQLSASAARRSASSGPATAAIGRLDAAAARLDAMTIADLDSSTTALNAGAGSTTPGVPAPTGKKGLMSRIRGMGTGKAMAGLGALSMATMFMPTGDNESLNTATGILGGAGMGASMGMMAGPPGMLAGAIIGAAIPAITAYTDAQQKANDAMVRYGQALNGGALSIEQFGKELNRKTPAQRLTEAISGLNISAEAQQSAQSIMQTETGQSMLGMARQLGGADRISALTKQLQQLTLSEIFTPEEAKAVAQELAVELGDPLLGQALLDGIVSVLGSNGQLIKDTISQQFISSIPSSEEIASYAPTFETLYKGGGEIGKVYTETDAQIAGKMSLTVAALKSLKDAEDLATLSMQSGQITREEYLKQLDDINAKRSTAMQIAQDLIDTGVSLVGAESVIGDIAAMNNVTEEYDKVVDRVEQLQSLISATDIFAVPLQTMAAYGELASGDIQNVIDMVNANPDLKLKVQAIFDTPGAEARSLEILKLINSGMDIDKIKLVIDTRGADKGVDLLTEFTTMLATLPPDAQAKINFAVQDDGGMTRFLSEMERFEQIIEDPKQLKVRVDSDPRLKEVRDNWEAFLKLPPEQRLSAIMDAIYNIDFNYTVSGDALPSHIRPAVGSNIVDSAVSSAISSLGGVASGGGGGGGGSTDTKAIEEAYDKQIAKQDELIERIQKEREERQKLLDLEKQAFDFAMREQDLKNQIARARAEGRTADAAMLQAQLDNARAEEKQKEAERRRQEQEDRRIEAANKRKEALEKDKKDAVDAAKGGGGGGGGAEGISQETADAIQMATMAVEAFTKTDFFKQKSGNIGAYSAFFDSKRVATFRKEMEKLQVPAEVIDDILNQIYDDMITSDDQYTDNETYKKMRDDLEELGLSGQKLEDMLPDVFGIIESSAMRVPEKIDLITEAFIDAGFAEDEAKNKALDFFEAQNTGIDIDSVLKLAEAYQEIVSKAKAAAFEVRLLNLLSSNPELSATEAAGLVQSEMRYAETGTGPLAMGGYVSGPGTSTSDSIPTMLSNGEYVIRAASVAKYGVPFLDAVNKGILPGAARGGLMSRYPTAARGMRSGGYLYRAMGGEVKDGYSEYNINVSVAGTDASADDIANKVMQTLQRRDKMNRAGIRL